MPKSYNEICQSAKYKLTGHGDRRIDALMECFEHMDPSMEADIYGTGGIINDFEKDIACFLGKENAVFFPSGTMAQQIALRIWCDAKGLKNVAYHPLCHLEIHEKDGMKILHHLEPTLLGTKDRLFNMEDLKSVNKPIACLLVELPQREIGGQLPPWEELISISEFCKNGGIKLHLDGARLFEILPYYNKSAADICSLFDSVYISFYKGLGGIAGAMLAGRTEFIESAKVWKRRHGGDLISLYPYIVSAKHSMNKRIGNMGKYWQHALTAAERLNKIEGVSTVPEVPVCNMFHAYFDTTKENLESIFADIIEKYNLAIVRNIREIDNSICKSELSFGDSFELIPQEILDKAFEQLESEFIKLVEK
ncbi:MAG TPA: low specificity L-threonine aldolase [Clostridiaceae bacterium]|nr:low specificity L-threonine aldolase [Clostridiaceae bacterium]